MEHVGIPHLPQLLHEPAVPLFSPAHGQSNIANPQRLRREGVLGAHMVQSGALMDAHFSPAGVWHVPQVFGWQQPNALAIPGFWQQESISSGLQQARQGAPNREGLVVGVQSAPQVGRPRVSQLKGAAAYKEIEAS